METKWHAVYTKNRWEKKVADLLTKREIENYCPLNMVIRKWSDRKKKVYEPLFTSYVFVHITQRQQTELMQVPGVVNLVYWLNKPAVIKDAEIHVIKQFLGQHESIRLEKTMVNVNDTVRVLSGPFMDYEGNVVEIRSNTVKVLLPSLGYQMCAELQKSNVKIVTDGGSPAEYSSASYGEA